MKFGRRYAVISPARDEAEYIRRTIASVVNQTVLPDRWVIMDDGSTDETPAIIAEAAREHHWITVITRPQRTTRVVGAGVIHAFNAGLRTLDLEDYEFLSKLDTDLELPPRYYEALLDRMEADPRLATASGEVWVDGPDGAPIADRGSEEMSAGLAKFYRVSAFQDIGGLVPQIMWDGIDSHESRRHGWRSRAFRGPDFQVYTMRAEGVSDRGVLRGRRRHGFGQWFMGTDPFFMLASSLLRAKDPPVVTGSLNMLGGYVWAAIRRVPQYGNLAFRSQLRRFQRESLLMGKARATVRWEKRTAHAWPGTPRACATAYFVSEYPALSHTFISREIAGLRRLGWNVVPMSARETSMIDNEGTICIRTLGPLLSGRHLLSVLLPFPPTRALRAALFPSGLRPRPIGLAYLVQAALLLGEMRSRGLQHVHVHFANNASEIARLAALLASSDTHSRPLTWSLTLHGLWMHGATGDSDTDIWPRKAQERWGPLRDKLTSAEFVTTISDNAATALRGIVDDANVHVIHMGVDTSFFVPGERADTELCSGLTVAYVGRLAPEKNLACLLEAVSRLNDIDKFRLIVAGSGSEQAKLEQLANRLGIADHVEWLGPVSQSDLPSVYQQADVVAMSSLNEGIPVALMEAMSSEVAVVAPAIGGIPELVEHEQTGLLVRRNDVESLTVALRKLQEDPALRYRLGRAGRIRVQSDFDAANEAARLSDLLRAVVLRTDARLRQVPGERML